MSRNITLAGIVVVLIAAYLSLFTDWFRRRPIQINFQPRPVWAGQSSLPFTLDGEYRLTEIKVVALAATNAQNAKPAWHLIRSTNAPPTSYFIYGKSVAGLKPSPDTPTATRLTPNASYRLSVRAGRATGQLDFRAPNYVVE